MGYAGGRKPRPTYHDLGQHAEAIQLEYDPEHMTYDELLDLFFANHRPVRPPWKRQYMSAIFYADDAQRRQAEAKVEEVVELWEAELFVEILSADSFYRAEDYHQKYYLQRHTQLLDELVAAYPDDFQAVVDSTAAARLNGYLGRSRVHTLEPEGLSRLGLSEAGQRILLSEIRHR